MAGFENFESMQREVFEQNWRTCYATDNTFAYHIDLKNEQKAIKCGLKVFNFVPTTDTWCLACGNKSAPLQCARCRHVHFCNLACQRKAYPVHRRHCGRDLFCRCVKCGALDTALKCVDCQARWCSGRCRDATFDAHMAFDCRNFQRMFPWPCASVALSLKEIARWTGACEQAIKDLFACPTEIVEIVVRYAKPSRNFCPRRCEHCAPLGCEFNLFLH